MRFISSVLLLCAVTANAHSSTLPITLTGTPLPFTLPFSLPALTFPALTLLPATQTATQESTSAPTQKASSGGSSSSSTTSLSSFNSNYVCQNSGGYNSFGKPPAGGYSCQTSSKCGHNKCACGNACYDPTRYCCYEGHLGQAVGMPSINH